MFLFNSAITRFTLSKYDLRRLYEVNEVEGQLNLPEFVTELELILQDRAAMNVNDVKRYISILQYLHYQEVNLDFSLGWLFQVAEAMPEAKTEAYSLLCCLLTEDNCFIMLARIKKVRFHSKSLLLGFESNK